MIDYVSFISKEILFKYLIYNLNKNYNRCQKCIVFKNVFVSKKHKV